MRGRKPVPTELRLLRGNPGHRPINQLEPKPSKGVGSRPAWLALEAKREWTRIVPELERIGVLTTVDRGAVAAYCQLWAEFVAATAEGDWRKMKQAAPLVKAAAAELGITPSSRSRVHVPVAPTNEIDALLA